MISIETYETVLYFLVFFKFVFIIIYTVHMYGLLFDKRVYDNSLKTTIIMENIFVIAMGFILLYRFSKDTIQIKTEERVLMWTLTFVMILNGLVKLSEINWEFN